MSPSVPQPDHAAIEIQELFEWVTKHRINGTIEPSTIPDRPFIPFSDLETYLKAQAKTKKLLQALNLERLHDVNLEMLEENYLRVFMILILIGKGRYIECFTQRGNLRDSQLPFLEKPTHFPIDPEDPKFWESFYVTQFELCAHHFHRNENYNKIEDPCILPIISKDFIGSGGSADIYKVTLHPYYDKLGKAADFYSVRLLSLL